MDYAKIVHEHTGNFLSLLTEEISTEARLRDSQSRLLELEADYQRLEAKHEGVLATVAQQQAEILELKRAVFSKDAVLKESLEKNSKLSQSQAAAELAAEEAKELLARYGSYEAHMGIALESAWRVLRSASLQGCLVKLEDLAGEASIHENIPPLLRALLRNASGKALELREREVAKASFPQAAEKKEELRRSIAVGDLSLPFLEYLSGLRKPFTAEDIVRFPEGDAIDLASEDPAVRSDGANTASLRLLRQTFRTPFLRPRSPPAEGQAQADANSVGNEVAP